MSKVWDVAATTNAISELGEQLVGQGIEKVTVECTSDYWRIWFYLLEAAGLDVQLVNARDVKNVPGRPKTDKLDAVWLAKLTEKGMLRPSFVPPRRDPAAARLHPAAGRPDPGTHPVLATPGEAPRRLADQGVVGGLHAGHPVGPRHVEALIGGERDPRVLAGLARGKMKAKHAALVEALTGRFDDHHAELARMLLDQIDAPDHARSTSSPPASTH